MAAADGDVPAFEPELPLHCAAASPAADVRAVAQLLAADPGSAAVQDRHGMTPLAWSCARRAPAAVVQCLLDAHPGAAHEHTAGGMLPLHWAAQCKATLEVVTLLLSLRAAHAAERDALGRLPLHAAAGGAGTVAVLDALIEAHPTGGGEEDNLGRRALHHAVGTKAPQESVAYLLRAHPDAARTTDRRGRTPLHTAAAKGATAGVISALLETYPEASAQKDSEGKVPLHYAVSRGAPPDVVALILASYPEGAAQRARGGMLPLHLAAACGAPPGVVSQLVDAYPEGLREPGGTGRLALHMAAAGGAPLESLCELLASFPDAARARDAQGRLPFHCACEAKAQPDVLAQLAAAFPEALRIPHAGVRPLTAWLTAASGEEVARLQATGLLSGRGVMRAAMHDVVRFPHLAHLVRDVIMADPELAYVAEDGSDPTTSLNSSDPNGGTGSAVGSPIGSRRPSLASLTGLPGTPTRASLADLRITGGIGGSASSDLMRALQEVARSSGTPRKTGSPGGGGSGGSGSPNGPLQAIDVACAECRAVMLAHGYFLRRYEILTAPAAHPPAGGGEAPDAAGGKGVDDGTAEPGSPSKAVSPDGDEPLVVYSSSSSGTTVLLAVDSWADDSSEHRVVALKCMRQRDKLSREVARRQGLSSQFVVPILRVHVGPSVAEEAAARGLAPHIAVLSRCDGTLDAALAARPRRGPASAAPSLGGRDWDAARRVTRSLIAALAHVHDAGLVHCDLRPSNIASTPGDGDWKLLDLYGAVDFKAGEYVSERCSAAFSPPEAVYLPDPATDPAGVPCLKTVAERGVLEAWEPGSLKAHPTFDAWSLGAVLYHVIADCPLWPAAQPDGSLSADGLRRLAAWDDTACETKLAPLLREPLSNEATPQGGPSPAASRDAAVDLLRYLLRPRPADRPHSMGGLLRHRFCDPTGGALVAQLRDSSSGYSLVAGTGLGGTVTTALLSGGIGGVLWRGMATALAYTSTAAAASPARHAAAPVSPRHGSAAPQAGGQDPVRGTVRRSFDRHRGGAATPGPGRSPGGDPVRL